MIIYSLRPVSMLSDFAQRKTNPKSEMTYWIIWSWYTGHWWVDCYIWHSEEGTGRGRSPPRPLFAVPNVTSLPSTASVPVIVLLCDGSLLCADKGLKSLACLLAHWAVNRLLSRRLRQRQRFSASTLFICSSVCLFICLFVCLSVDKMQKRDFLKN